MTDTRPSDATSPRIIQWLLDTRPLWPVPSKPNSRDEVQELERVASRELSLLSNTEQASVLKYYHLKDAKMALASHLLKHLAIAKHLSIPWSQSTISRDSNKKPIFNSELHQAKIGFNVSHQAGIVSLIAAVGFKERVDVGTDVVCTNERIEQDYRHIDKEGFFNWVDIYTDVFAESEVNHMKLGPVEMPCLKIEGCGREDALFRCQWRSGEIMVRDLEGGGDGMVGIKCARVIDAKLRRFYASWCLREAYVKMTGEALLASWLKELQISGVQPPAAKEGGLDADSLDIGRVKRDFMIFFKGVEVHDVRMELTAIGKHYMIGGSVRVPKGVEESALVMGEWKQLDLERDILAIAEAVP